MPNSMQPFIHHPLTTISSEDTFSRFSSNSEADASELLENLEENVSSLLASVLPVAKGCKIKYLYYLISSEETI